jgi:hypothetical protein
MLFRFTLTYSGADTVVDEPMGWVDFESEIDRDFKSHGVMFKFTSGSLKLGFSGGGRDVLETAFQNDGFDAVVTLTIDERASADDTWSNLWVGNAVMENRTYDRDFFEVDFEESTFVQKVINRADTKVRLDSTEDLDGNTLTGSLTSYTNSWGGIRIASRYVGDYKTGGNENTSTQFTETTADTGGGSFYQHLLVNFDGTLEDDLKEYQVITEDLIDDQLGTASGNQNLIAGISGDLTVTGSVKYRIQGTLTTTVSGDIFVRARWKLRHENAAGTLQSEQTLSTYTEGGTDPLSFDSGVTTDTFTETTVSSVSAGDKLFIYLEIEADVDPGGGPDTSSISTTYDLYHSSQYTMSILKDQENYTVKHYQIFDVLEWILYIISGQANALQSSFLDYTENGAASDGCGGLNMITNGYQLRGIDNAPEISLNDVLESIDAIYGTGYSFEKNYNNGYDLRVELMEYFYGDGEIVDLGSPLEIKEGGSYKEETFQDLVINNVNIGYEKYSNDEDFRGNLDDFLTESNYSLPISTVKGRYTKKSPLIASGRLIQATFEERDEPNKVWKYDKNNFIIAVRREASLWKPENDENFETVTGIDDSTTAYNIKFAPVYMLLNHALIINSSLFGKDVTEKIKNTDTAINQSFTAQFDIYEDCLLGDSQRLSRTSVGDIQIQNNYQSLRLFKPTKHVFVIALSTDQRNTIIDAIENNADDSTKNYGYLTYQDNEGNTQTGYPINIKWNPNSKIATIETIEKADNYGI